MIGQGSGGFQVVIDPQQFYRFKKELDAFDPALSRALRKRIREAGKVAEEAVKKRLGMSSPAGGPDKGAGRAALIAGTRVSVSFGKRAAGARVITTGRNLPAGHEGLLKVYNKASFRHPVYGRSSQSRAGWTWVTQKGRPYFGSAIRAAMTKAVVDEIFNAVDDAYKAIGARGI